MLVTDSYNNEKNVYMQLSSSFMCPLIEYDDNNNAVILKYLDLGSPADFNDNIALTNFFNKVFNDEQTKNYIKIMDSIAKR